MKKNLLTLVMLLMVIGGGNVWADTYEWSHDGQKSALAVTATKDNNNGETVAASSYTGYSLSYDGTTYTSAVKIDSPTTITFKTTVVSDITIGVVLKNGQNYTDSKPANIKFDGIKSASLSTETISGTSSYKTVTYEDVAAGDHTIKRGDNEVGVFYIKVVETGKPAPTLAFPTASGIIIPAGSSSTTINSALESNNGGTATYSIVDGYTVTSASIDSSTGLLTVSGEGTVTVKAQTAATETYAAGEATKTYTVWQGASHTISVANLCYNIGPAGKSANDNGLDRTVGGFALTFGGGQGVKYNGSNQLLFRNSGSQGVMTVAPDVSNSGKWMTEILLTVDKDASSLLTADAGTLTKVSDTQMKWTGSAYSVTFTHAGDTDFNLSAIQITTNTATTFTKVTPTITLSPTSASITAGTAGTYSPTATMSPKNFNWTWNVTKSSDVSYYTRNESSTEQMGDPGTFKTTAETTTTGNNTMVASFDGSGNPYYNTANNAATYTLTVNEAGFVPTHVWNFETALSAIDKEILKASDDTWAQNGNDTSWKLAAGSINGPITQNGKELEKAWGLLLNATKSSSTLVGDGEVRVNADKSLTIPNLKAGDKVRITFVNPSNGSDNRGIAVPANLTSAENFGGKAPGTVTASGTIEADGNLVLTTTGGPIAYKSIRIESSNNPWPTLAFANCAAGGTVNVDMGANPTYTNAVTGAPGSVTYEVLVGDATVNNSGVVTFNSAGKVVIRANTAAATGYSAYYCDYMINVTSSKENLSTFAFNSDEVILHGSENIYVNGTTFVYDANNQYLKAKLFLSPDYTDIDAALNSTYFTVTSSDETVLKVTGETITITKPSDQRLYIDGVKVLKAGTATLTFNFLGSSTYNAKSFEVPITVVAPLETYDDSYPFTWDFKNNDWTTSKLQVNYGYRSWSTNANEARPTVMTISSNSGIDMIQGLAFTMANAADLCLDWTGKQLWMNADGTVTIPNLTLGQVVTVTTSDGSSNFEVASDAAGRATKYGNTFTVTTAGDLKLRMTAATYINSISVATSSTTATWAFSVDEAGQVTRTINGESKTFYIKGTVTFTGAGDLAGGTEITDLPGITLKLGADGESGWSVFSESHVGLAAKHTNNGASRPNCTSGCYYVFTPTVNGYLTLNMLAVDDHTYLYTDGKNDDGYSRDFGKVATSPYDSQRLLLLAGHSYTLVGQNTAVCLHSFSFEPAFVDGTTVTDLPGNTIKQVTEFTGYVSTASAEFPQLVNGKNVGVRFSGNREVVLLSADGGCEIVGGGSTAVRGRIFSGDNEISAFYDLTAAALVSDGTEPTSGSRVNYLDNDVFQFKFKDTAGSNITIAKLDACSVTLMAGAKNITNEIGTIAVDATNDNRLNVSIPTSVLGSYAGETFTITLNKNSVKRADDETGKIVNGQIVGTFTLSSDEPDLTMIYPTTTSGVRIGTSIVLRTMIYDSSEDKYVNVKDILDSYEEEVDGKKTSHTVTIKGYLKADGEDGNGMEIIASKEFHKIIFKPTSPLLPGTAYTLTIPKWDSATGTGVMVKDGGKTISHDKIFTFTTGTATGEAPVMTASAPYNGQDGKVETIAYEGGVITFTFNQNLEVEPYSIVSATPVNGSEATARATTMSVLDDGTTTEDASKNAVVDATNKNVLKFNYSKDQLKYDVYYKLLIPANTVTGTGGKPNAEDIVVYFKMQPNPNVVNKTLIYPYTWDFGNLGSTTLAGLASSTTISSDTKNDHTWRGFTWKYETYREGAETRNYEDQFRTVKHKTKPLDQGTEIGYTVDGGTTTLIPEMKGLRISMVSDQSEQLRIRKSSGTHYLHVNGNTHYLTVPSLKKGEKLYIKAQANGFFNVNSLEAKFTQGGASEQIGKTGQNTYIVELKDGYEEADVTFCIDNVSFYKMGVPVAYKTGAKSTQYYFTDCQAESIKYGFTEDFTDNPATAYYVDAEKLGTADAYEKGATTINLKPLAVSKPGEGVIIQGSSSTDESTISVPLFRTDVNTTYAEHETALKGVLERTYMEPTVGNAPDGYRNYIFTNLAGKTNPETGELIGDAHESTLGFYRATSGYLAANKSYLQLPMSLTGDTESSGAKYMIFLNFLDWDDEEPTAVRHIDVEPAGAGAESVYYTLTGVRLNKRPTAKGIYIMNGKKVYIK